jgi:hypothetical protein
MDREKKTSECRTNDDRDRSAKGRTKKPRERRVVTNAVVKKAVYKGNTTTMLKIGESRESARQYRERCLEARGIHNAESIGDSAGRGDGRSSTRDQMEGEC